MSVQINVQRTINGIKRTASIRIMSTYGAVPSIEAEREILTLQPDNTMQAREYSPPVNRLLTDCPPSQTVTVNGKTLNAQEVAEAVKQFIDLWDPA